MIEPFCSEPCSFCLHKLFKIFFNIQSNFTKVCFKGCPRKSNLVIYKEIIISEVDYRGIAGDVEWSRMVELSWLC